MGGRSLVTDYLEGQATPSDEVGSELRSFSFLAGVKLNLISGDKPS
jgi:hypothetical protein